MNEIGSWMNINCNCCELSIRCNSLFKEFNVYLCTALNRQKIDMEFFLDNCLLSYEDVGACCEDHKMINENSSIEEIKTKYSNLTAGISWGRGSNEKGVFYTVFTIGGLEHSSNKRKILFIKKYDNALCDYIIELNDIIRLIRRFNLQLVVADDSNHSSNAIMFREFGPSKFIDILNCGTIKEKIKYDKQSNSFLMNRKKTIPYVINMIRRKEISFFCIDEFKPYISDFIGMYYCVEYSGDIRYDNVVPCDCFDSLISWVISQF